MGSQRLRIEVKGKSEPSQKNPAFLSRLDFGVHKWIPGSFRSLGGWGEGGLERPAQLAAKPANRPAR